MRIKNQWFQSGKAKTPEQTASAMAFITWRVVQNTLKQMRSAKFDIDVGPQYFAVTREMLAFLLQVCDRLAFEYMGPNDRVSFVHALVVRVAEILQENEDSYLGSPPGDEASHFDTFIDLYNEVAEHYADFGCDADGPDFAFVRYLGHRLERLLPEKDRLWVIDQMMAAEVPQAVELVRRGLSGLLDTERQRSRRRGAALAGE
mgnify:CR=1 FL=1